MFETLVGQKSLKKKLQFYKESCDVTQKMPFLFFVGAKGLGKTEFAKQLAKEIKNTEVKWIVSGNKGEYLFEYFFDGRKYNKEVLITEKNRYKEPVKRVKDKIVKSIETENKPKKLLNLFGWKVGWLGTYIIFSILFSIIIRIT